MKAVIPAAGLGTRFLPATKAQPKEMLPVYNKPTIQYVVEEAVASGIDDILIITGKGKRSIEDHFDRSFELEYSLRNCGKMDYLVEVEAISEMADIYYVRQKQQKGLGDAIHCAKKHIDGQPFAVLLGDTISQSKVPCTKQLLDVHEKYNASAIAIERVPYDKIERYGIIKGQKVEDSVYKIEDMVEKPRPEDAPSDLAITGRYVLESEIFDHIEEVPPGVGGEIQLTDAMRQLDNIYGHIFDGKMYDIGNNVEWLKSSLEIALQDPAVSEELREYLKNIIK
ncbi:MAG: UTP--glucose-1-phosphate uridylyltransferase GalU [Methanobacterium sp.]|jgi:UTP--glucose-1-phosphate uridylyltransferase|uniref:UTP--glucose-1-phosphate uridylyltransferase n=1 Tax=Methanobacterium subterraneum TaxID=59277 RepID=A0A2H4V9X5_9EURY|nr:MULTISPECIES: UTP--glucose-1-phosphate uridylyltransferase GalU [Methanobacterium]AUB54873.1 UTP--glucose-1-phosphate uridylyltransferase [Methanobacterium subterraneum]AUB58140.1 UTP--glucose-1-phosphate uridylyltransferase [Methanobacterium sp. MZ-A1]MBW4256777.1 UTP--glucose-1-phosphate uridylyltransferase GalU [Methanobacterium sp. YSL]MCC7560542.1 UTP--glucose-1-phosphate uridylyltransferase GalU [Methanobacterium sp.]